MVVEKKQDYITFASVVSSIAVIYMHTNNCFWAFSSTERYWLTATFINSFFQFAVPVFYLITGATLIDYRERYDTKTFFKRRLSKLLVPYVFWNAFGFLFQLFYLKSIKMEDVSVWFILNGFINGRLVNLYWFFIPLTAMYLAMPLFSSVAEEKRKKLFTYLAIGVICNGIILPFIVSIFALPVSVPTFFPFAANSVLYILMGYLLTRLDFSPRKRKIIYLFGILGFFACFLGTYLSSIRAEQYISVYNGSNNFPCFLYSIAVFVFFRYEGNRLSDISLIRKTVAYLKQYTFSFYLIHWYLLNIFVRLTKINTKSILHRMLTPWLIIGISIIFTEAARKTRFGRKILPY